MLTNEKVREVQGLLELGLSHRAVAAKANVSKGTVMLVAQGRRVAAPEWVEPNEPATVSRCPACGAKVLLPCVACRARRFAARQRLLAAIAPPRPDAGLHGLRLVRGMAESRRRPRRRPSGGRPRRVA